MPTPRGVCRRWAGEDNALPPQYRNFRFLLVIFFVIQLYSKAKNVVFEKKK
uniref:Uncharacterized protein n=1 Tax=Lepeophtheirus salmonis TaxID=72036 RepID=A0A0K2VID5_LEPSM